MNQILGILLFFLAGLVLLYIFRKKDNCQEKFFSKNEIGKITETDAHHCCYLAVTQNKITVCYYRHRLTGDWVLLKPTGNISKTIIKLLEK